MNKTEIRNTIGTFGSVRERQKQKREFVLDFIANTPPERRVQVPLGAMDQQAPPTALGEFIAKDPAAVAKGVGVAPFTIAPDLVGIGQHAVNAVADLLPDEFGVLQRDSNKPVFENPMSGDPIREAVGLDPANPQGIAGEVASPVGTIAKALGIGAKAVVAGAKLAAGTSFPTQLAMTLFHGTPFKFNKFNLDKIGTGEGAQAYGHGLYFAENKGVAGQYQRNLSGNRFVRADGSVFDASDVLENPNIRATLERTDGDLDAALDRVLEIQESIPGTEGARLAMHDANTLQMLKASGGIKRESGHLYEVDIPDSVTDKMLDWDAPLSEQGAALEPVARAAAKEHPGIVAEVFNESGMRGFASGGDFYRSLSHDLGGQEAASKALNEAGIPGIRFFDGNSRSAKEGTRNIVAFNPDDIAQVKRDGEIVHQATEVSPLAFVRGGASAEKVTDLNRAPFIYDDAAPTATPNSQNLVDVGMDLQDEAIKVWGGKPMEMTPENAQVVAKNMTDEARESFKRRPEMAGWYKANLEEAMGYASEIHPELATDPQAQTAFKTIMAITSNGQEVPLNAKLTNQFYTKFKETGRFPIAGSGKEKKAMEIGFQHANEIIDDVGFDGFTAFLSKEFTVKQLQDAGFKVSGENVDTIVNGSVIFGPKIGGGFMQNLMGNYDPATFDRWWQRTYGRHSGTLIEPPLKIGDQRLAFAEALEDTPAEAFSALGMTKSDALANPDDAARVVLAGFTKGGFKVKSEVNNAARNLMKSLDNVVDSPAGGNQRNYMRSVITQVRDNLRAEGIQIDTADVQALLWYAEKDLYGKLGASSNTGRVDYATVWREIAEEARSSATP